jgi:hypothetical protein
MTTHAGLTFACIRAVHSLDILEQVDAARAADRIVDLIIEGLRGGPDIPWRSYDAWALRLADLRQDVEVVIAGALDTDRENVCDAIDAIIDQLEELGIVRLGQVQP